MEDKNIKIIALIIGLSALIFLLIVTFYGIFFPSGNRFNRECVNRHNYYRGLHGSPSLSSSSDMIKLAEERAQELKTTDVFAHRPNLKLGENLYQASFSYENSKSLETLECETAIKLWYEEIKDYDFRRGVSKTGKMIGHFTQLVWTDTFRVGCAKSYSRKSRSVYLVCNYDPPGNYLGTYTQKVPAPLSK